MKTISIFKAYENKEIDYEQDTPFLYCTNCKATSVHVALHVDDPIERYSYGVKFMVKDLHCGICGHVSEMNNDEFKRYEEVLFRKANVKDQLTDALKKINGIEDTFKRLGFYSDGMSHSTRLMDKTTDIKDVIKARAYEYGVILE
jgi:hypothetical protein